MLDFDNADRFSLACNAYERAVELTRNHLSQAELAYQLNEYYCFLSDNNQFTKCEAYIEESVSIRAELCREHPEMYEPDLAVSYNNLANLYGTTQRFMKAKRCINRHWLYMNAWQRKIHSQTNRTWLIRITTWPFYITIWPFYITIFSITMKAKRCTNRHWLYVNAWRRKFRRYTNRTWQPHIITWLIYIAIPSGSRKVNLCTNRQ